MLGSALEQEQIINDIFKKQQANDQKKSWTLQLNQLVRYIRSMFEKYEPTTLLSFSVIFTWFWKRNQLHINFFLFSTCTNSCPNEEGHGGQNENQPDICTTWNVNFYMSDDWDKPIDKNLEQLIIPKPSVPQKVMYRGRSAQRLAASNKQNHCSHCGQPGHTKSHGSRITCPTLLQSHQQPSKQAAPSTENDTTLQLFFEIA